MGESVVAHISSPSSGSHRAVGVLLKIALPGRYDHVSIALYLLIGWSGAFAWESIAQLPTLALWLMVTGDFSTRHVI